MTDAALWETPLAERMRPRSLAEYRGHSSILAPGMPLRRFCALRGIEDYERMTGRIAREVRESAYEIIRRKGATCYGVAMAAVRVCEAVVRNEKSVLPVSCVQRGLYGVEDVALSLPAVVGRNCVETVVPIALNNAEADALRRSADTLRGLL